MGRQYVDDGVYYPIVNEAMTLFFADSPRTVDLELWNEAFISITNAIVEQLTLVSEAVEVLNFRHHGNAGMQTWATTF